jgi:hypothetical protein
MRNVVAVVVGYLGYMAAMFVLFTAAWFILHPSGAFEPGSWDISSGWAMATVAIALISGGVAGRVSAFIGHNQNAVLWVCGLILILGLLAGSGAMTQAPTEVRPENIDMIAAMQKARNPVWVAIISPIAGAIGAYLASVRRTQVESVMAG